MPFWKRRQNALRSGSMIVSRQNQKLKNIRRLRRCKGDKAILEGPHLIREATSAGCRIEIVLATEQFLAGAEGHLLAQALEVEPETVARPLLDELSDADSPKGVIAVVSLPRGGCEQIPIAAGGLVVLVDGMQDPGNLGALARVAEAFAADAIALTPGCVHPNHPRALRASAGSLLRLPVARDVQIEELERRLQPVSPRWLALETRGGVALGDADLSGSLIVMLGSEGSGLSPALSRRSDLGVTITTDEPLESLNVTVAAAIVLYERYRGQTSSST